MIKFNALSIGLINRHQQPITSVMMTTTMMTIMTTMTTIMTMTIMTIKLQHLNSVYSLDTVSFLNVSLINT